MHVDRCAPKAYQWFKDVPYYKAIYNCSLVACYICILETIWRRMFLLCFVISLLKRTPKELTMRNVLQVVYVPGKDFTIMQRPQFFFLYIDDPRTPTVCYLQLKASIALPFCIYHHLNTGILHRCGKCILRRYEVIFCENYNFVTY